MRVTQELKNKNGKLWNEKSEEMMMLVREEGNIHRKRRVGSAQLKSIELDSFQLTATMAGYSK